MTDRSETAGWRPVVCCDDEKGGMTRAEGSGSKA
jgi:hypothetical protein